MSRAVLAFLLAMAGGCTQLASSADRARSALDELGAAGFTIPLADRGAIEVPPGKLEAVAVDVGPGSRGSFEAFAQLSITGRLDGVPLSYVGNERFRIRCDPACRVDGPVAPRLAAVAGALVARRAALAGGDPALLASLAAGEPRLEPDSLREAAERPAAGWFIRVEGDEAVVGEADPGGRQKRLQLVGEGGAWRFSSGLP